MIYFDNAATTMPKPPQVAEAVAGAINSCGNPSRGAHEASLASLRILTRAREALADYFGAESPSQVAFTMNATAALNIAIAGIHGHIVTTAAEHNSVLRPLYRRGNYTVMPLDALGRLDPNALRAAIRPDTGAIVMTHASNLTGNVFDLFAAGEICRENRLRLIVDAAQTAGLLPVNMRDCGISALCFSGHKSLYGPQGTGGICLGEGYRPHPLIVGGSGSESFSERHPAAMPDALEAGTQNAHGVAGLLAGLEYVRQMDGNCFPGADHAARRFAKTASELGGYTFYGDLDAELRAPIVALNHARLESAMVAHLLGSRYGIAVRAGAHCAPLMHRALGTEHTGVVRFSFSHFNTDAEIDSAISALEELDREI